MAKLNFFISLLLIVALYAFPAFSEQQASEKELRAVAQELEKLGTLTEPQPVCNEVEESDGLCQDMFKFTCAPGEYNDGTGQAISTGAMEEKMAQTRAKLLPLAKESFLKTLRNPENVYFRKLAVSTLGLTHAPQCAANVKDENCINSIADTLAKLTLKKLYLDPSSLMGMGGMGFGQPFPGFTDLVQLTSNSVFKDTERDFVERTKKEIKNVDFENKINKKIFPEVRKLLMKTIDDRVVDPKIRQTLKEKISGIAFKGTNCEFLGPMPDGEPMAIAMLFVPNAFYDPRSHTFQYCNGFLLSNQSEFQIVQIIAHELSHSIDPCNVSIGPADFKFNYTNVTDTAASEKEFPFQNLISCLRSEQSVHAIKIGVPQIPTIPEPLPSQIPSPIPSQEPGSQPSPTGPVRTLSGKSVAQALGNGNQLILPSFCANDQIGEAFCDWVAAEIVPEYMQKNHPGLSRDQLRTGYSNAWRGLCDNLNPTPHSPQDVHSSLEDRLNKIMLQNPKIRKQMGCTTQPSKGAVYCDPASTRSSK